MNAQPSINDDDDMTILVLYKVVNHSDRQKNENHRGEGGSDALFNAFRMSMNEGQQRQEGILTLEAVKR